MPPDDLTACGISLENRLGNFSVGVTNTFDPAGNNNIVRGSYSLCGQYPGITPLSARVTMNCAANMALGRYVIFQQVQFEAIYVGIFLRKIRLFTELNEEQIVTARSRTSDPVIFHWLHL